MAYQYYHEVKVPECLGRRKAFDFVGIVRQDVTGVCVHGARCVLKAFSDFVVYRGHGLVIVYGHDMGDVWS